MIDNRTALESFEIFSQMDEERNLPLKFEYGLGRLVAGLKPVATIIHKMRGKKIDGQAEYEKAKTDLFESLAEKDDKGQPIRHQIPTGIEYDIRDRTNLAIQLDKVADEHKDAIAAIEARVAEFNELLDKEAEFKPYMIKIQYLPMDEDGKCSLSVKQIRYLIPFLHGKIDDIPDPVYNTEG